MKLKRLILLVLCTAGLALQAEAQSSHSATYTGISITAGAFGSGFQPDYAGTGVPATGPERLYGYGTFVDVKFSRWVQIEAEGRWLKFNQYRNINESSYLIGPRIPLHRYHRFTPYGKLLVGISNGSFLVGNATTWAYGGGVDYRLNKHFNVRAFDIEYQNWNIGQSAGALKPYGINAGISYRIR